VHPPHDPALVEVRRSRKRARTVSAWREGERTVVAIPARFTRAQEKEWVHRMVNRLADQERRRRPSDVELAARASELSSRYLGGRAVPTSVRWSTNHGRRWGSCTPSDGTIRISDRVRGMPRWVLDYVLLHELTHLLHAGHGADFWAELDSYPRTARAQGFLEGYAFREERASGEPAGDAEVDEDDVVDDTADDAVDDVVDDVTVAVVDDGTVEVVDDATVDVVDDVAVDAARDVALDDARPS
jgi:predicted metal-dependent hydrolase